MEVRPDSSSARKLGYGIVDGGSEDLNPSFPAEIKIRVNSGGSFVGFGKFHIPSASDFRLHYLFPILQEETSSS